MTAPPTGPLPPTGAPTLPVRGGAAPAWRVGQVLAATVVSAPRQGLSDLRIGTLLVRAQTGALQLSPGQTLRLEVASLKEQPVLRLLNQMAADPLNAALRNALPRQQPLAPLLASLARIAGDARAARQLASGITRGITPEIARAAQDLFSRLPAAATLGQAGGLREALRNSGLFLESKLAHTVGSAALPAGPLTPARTPDVGADFKANLIRLVQVLRENAATSTPAAQRGGGAAPAAAATTPPVPPAALSAAAVAALANARLPASAALHGDPGAPPRPGQPPQPQSVAAFARLAALEPLELLRQSEGALARIQLNQLSSLTGERPTAGDWLIELPVRRDGDIDLWGLRIGREPDRDGAAAGNDGAPGWAVTLAFDLPGLGPLQARIAVRGDRVSAQFFSPVLSIPPLVRAHLPLLDTRLRAAGLEVGELDCREGRLPAAAGADRTRILDERA